MNEESIARAALRAEIEALAVENAYLLDRGRFDELLELYTDDCEVVRPLPPFDGSEDETRRGRAALAQWHSGPEWPPTPRTMRHALSNFRITPIDRDHARATIVWTGYRHEGEGISVSVPMAVGDYEDEYRRCADGRWRIAKRRIVIAFLHQELLGVAAANVKAAEERANANR
jgi:3-phenylpropionate/cinnamic acid dioxygenase small subunit